MTCANGTPLKRHRELPLYCGKCATCGKSIEPRIAHEVSLDAAYPPPQAYCPSCCPVCIPVQPS